MRNEYKAWRGAVEPAGLIPSGNEYKAWRGAVEPSATVFGSVSGSGLKTGPGLAFGMIGRMGRA